MGLEGGASVCVGGLSQVRAEVLVKVKRVTWVPAMLEDMDGHGSSPMSVAGSCLVSL